MGPDVRLMSRSSGILNSKQSIRRHGESSTSVLKVKSSARYSSSLSGDMSSSHCDGLLAYIVLINHARHAWVGGSSVISESYLTSSNMTRPRGSVYVSHQNRRWRISPSKRVTFYHPQRQSVSGRGGADSPPTVAIGGEH